MLKWTGIALIVFGAYTYTWSFFLGVLVGTLPIIMGISLIAGSRIRGMTKKYLPKTIKVCPECKTPIPGDAIVCYRCEYRYPEAPTPSA